MGQAKKASIPNASLKTQMPKGISWNDLFVLGFLPSHLQPKQKGFDFSSSSLAKMGKTVVQNSAESTNG